MIDPFIKTGQMIVNYPIASPHHITGFPSDRLPIAAMPLYFFGFSPDILSTIDFLKNLFNGTSALNNGTANDRTAKMSTFQPLNTKGLTPNDENSHISCQKP